MDLVIDNKSIKVDHDVTHCIACGRRFCSDDIRCNVYKDSAFVGVIHDTCYDTLSLAAASLVLT